MKTIIKILKALSDETRFRIINMLLKREVCVCEISEVLKISQPAVSKHIKKLKDTRLVKERKNSYWSYYSLDLKNKKAKKIINLILKETKEEKVLRNDIKTLNKVSCKLKKEGT